MEIIKTKICTFSCRKSIGKRLFAARLLMAVALCNSWVAAQVVNWQDQDPADVLADVLTASTQATGYTLC